jgi:hypothetical protein
VGPYKPKIGTGEGKTFRSSLKPQQRQGGKAMVLQSCLLFWSLINGIDPQVTQAVIKVESNYNQMAVGRHGDSGLMQIRHKLVPESQLQLLTSCTNIMRGTDLLRKAKEKCKNCVDITWVNCYNLGARGCQKLKYPKRWRYYVKVTKEMK